jgi:hypothetical protein
MGLRDRDLSEETDGDLLPAIAGLEFRICLE